MSTEQNLSYAPNIQARYMGVDRNIKFLACERILRRDFYEKGAKFNLNT